jgi:hypothetical protein
MSKVLFNVLVTRFYKINTGFFLLLFLLLFALLDGKSTMQLHHAIMSGITTVPYCTAIAMLVWAAYNFKCISFSLKQIALPENSFLFRLQSLSDKKLLYHLLSVQASLYLPLLAYACVTVVIGCREHHYFLSGIFLVWQLVMCLVAASILYRRINSTWIKPAFTLPALEISKRKHFLFYLIHYSLSNRKATFIGIKLCSLLMLQAMVAANTDHLSKEAICVLIMFLISAHSLLPMYYVGFMEKDLAFTRNLPIHISRRLLSYVITYAIIFLPELLFLLLNVHHVLPLQLTLSLYAVAVSQLTLYTALQYTGVNTERYTSFVFALFFVTLLLLASFDLWFLFIAESVVSVALFINRYNKYELIRTE